MKTLHIYSSTKIALILFFKRQNENTRETHFSGIHLLETHVQRKGLLHVKQIILQKEIEIKNAFRPF